MTGAPVTTDDTLEKDRVSCGRLSDLPRLLLCSFDVIPGPSGSSRRLTEYLKALPDRFSVVVLSAKTPDHSHIEKYQGARLLRVPVGAGDLASRIQAFERAVKRQLDSEEYALAHFTDPFGGYVLCEMKADYGYRLIYEAQTFPSQELRYTHPQTEGDRRFLAKVRRQELFCLMNADLVITGSETTRTYIRSLGASTEQTRVMRAPVDLGPYTPDVLGAPDGQPMRLMYLGSQAGWQGVPTLLRALALALEQGAEVKLTLVGPRHPDWQPHLEDLAKELGLQEHVEFQPPVLHDDLVKVLALADVGVLPLEDVDRNRLQGGPLAKTAEYLAAGRPVIASDLPVTRELLPSSATVFHPPGDDKALAECILELARDVPRRLELGREARSFAEQELDAGLIRGKLLDIYDELLGKQQAVGARSEVLPEPTMTGTPTNRLPNLKPPESGKRPPRATRPSASKGTSRKAPPREELPLVMGQALSEDGLDTRLVKTEPDAHPTEPPVVMGLPLRNSSPSPSARKEDSTPIVRTPVGGRREEPEEPPTSIVNASSPPSKEDSAHTPIVRSPLGSSHEAPASSSSSSARASASAHVEEPPAPTPIVPMKPPGGRAAGAPRSEPGSNRAPASAASSSTGTRPALQETPAATPSTGTRPALQEPPPAAPSTSSRSALQESARGQELTDKGRPALPPLNRNAPPPESKGPPPRLSPVDAPLARTPAPIPAPAQATEEEPEEISEEEAQEISDDAALEAEPTPPHPRPRVEEPEELSSDEVEEADAAEALDAADEVHEADDVVEPVEDDVEDADSAVEAVDDMVEPVDEVLEPPGKPIPAVAQALKKPQGPDEADAQAVKEALDAPLAEPPYSALDPWFAQLAHGYCPPEGAQFARHTPPTNFPGRDEEPTDPSRVPGPAPIEGALRGKRS
jgi:glycosyltransferase involved in cell wall biosynthesis